MNAGEIAITKKKYINQVDGQVTVLFQLPCSDWHKLSQLQCWQDVEIFLQDIRSIHNQTCHTEKQGI